MQIHLWKKHIIKIINKKSNKKIYFIQKTETNKTIKTNKNYKK